MGIYEALSHSEYVISTPYVKGTILRRPVEAILNQPGHGGIPGELSKEDILNIIYDFIYTTFSYEATGDKWSLTAKQIECIIKDFRADFNNHLMSWSLINTFPYLDHAVGANREMTDDHNKRHGVNIEAINDIFKQHLSDPNDPVLSEREQIYAWVFTQTGSNTEAIKESKLDCGFHRRLNNKVEQSASLENCFKIRGHYLRSKKNIKDYIYSLRERKLTDLSVDKSYIQGQLIQVIEQIQEEGAAKDRTRLLRAIELLGKTIPGTFTETINVNEVRPDEALDRLLEMTKMNIIESKPRKLLDSKPTELFEYKQEPVNAS